MRHSKEVEEKRLYLDVYKITIDTVVVEIYIDGTIVYYGKIKGYFDKESAVEKIFEYHVKSIDNSGFLKTILQYKRDEQEKLKRQITLLEEFIQEEENERL